MEREVKFSSGLMMQEVRSYSRRKEEVGSQITDGFGSFFDFFFLAKFFILQLENILRFFGCWECVFEFVLVLQEFLQEFSKSYCVCAFVCVYSFVGIIFWRGRIFFFIFYFGSGFFFVLLGGCIFIRLFDCSGLVL